MSATEQPAPELAPPEPGSTAAPATPPTGEVTFLFTDIQGSTKLWEKHPQAMAVALARHDAIMRASIATHGGYVFKTIGDAFCAAFPDAGAGVNAALDAQRALLAEPWGETGPLRARMALHSGNPEFRDDDYFGQPVNRVARLLALGHGGQVLISNVTQTYLGADDLPTGVALRDLGAHRLKDLATPEPVYQLVAPDLPVSFPKLRTPPRPITGALASVGTSLLVLLGVSATTAPALSLSVLYPSTIFRSFKGLLIELSAFQEYFLLAAAAALLALLIVTAWVWKRSTEFRPGQRPSGAVAFAGNFVSLRTISFVAMWLAIVAGAYGYQQYLWRVALPIPDDAVGIALTREAAAASVREELADALFAEGQAQQVVVRELPVRFDATDTAEARKVGRRIGAQAVVIYRAEERDGADEYIAYVVFTDPQVGLSVAGNAQPSEPSQGPDLAVVANEGVAVPALRTETVSSLVSAAAGVIAYHDGDYREAANRLESARGDGDGGIVNFYLGSAYEFLDEDEQAAAAYDRAIDHYESRIAAGERLGVQDQLMLAKAYHQRGRVEFYADRTTEALAWYAKAVELREPVLARVGDLERPADAHASFARLYGDLADAHRLLGDAEEERFWAERARDEADAIADDTDDTGALMQEGAAMLFIGDCSTAINTFERVLQAEPDNVDALHNLATVKLIQGDYRSGIDDFNHVLEIDAENVIALQMIGLANWLRAVDFEHYVDPSYLDKSEQAYQRILAIEPGNAYAHEQLADIGNWRADTTLYDFTALVTGDDLSYAKSQAFWSGDAERQQRALDALGDTIEQRRILASELEPGNIQRQLELADAYVDRLNLRYPLLPAIYDSQGAEGLQRAGEQLLADIEEVREWTGPALAEGSAATRVEKLQAYGYLLKALELEWSWDGIFGSFQADPEAASERAAATADEWRAATDAAVALAESAPLETADEKDAASGAYSSKSFVALLLDNDATTQQQAFTIYATLQTEVAQMSASGTQHVSTTCRVDREIAAGRALAAQGDHSGAIERYDAALAIEPDDAAALAALAASRFELGDTAGAIDAASRAAAADDAVALYHADLARYALVADDVARRDAEYDRFVELLRQAPPQERMGYLRVAVADLLALAEGRHEYMPWVAETLPRFRALLDAMAADGQGTYQYPNLYVDLARLALLAGDPDTAWALALRAGELDDHQPQANAILTLSVIHGGADATAQIAELRAELDDPTWSDDSGLGLAGRADLVTLVQAEVDRYLAFFPDRAGAVQPLLDALASEAETD